MDAARPVSERLSLPDEIGEVPDDREPHLGARETRLVAGSEADTLTGSPPRQGVAQEVPRERLDLAATVARVAGQPQRVGDIEHVARVLTVRGEVPLVGGVREHRVDEPLRVRHGHAELSDVPRVAR